MPVAILRLLSCCCVVLALGAADEADPAWYHRQATLEGTVTASRDTAQSRSLSPTAAQCQRARTSATTSPGR